MTFEDLDIGDVFTHINGDIRCVKLKAKDVEYIYMNGFTLK